MKRTLAVLVCAACLSVVFTPGRNRCRDRKTSRSRSSSEKLPRNNWSGSCTRAVERRLNLGGTLLAHEALVKGQIDLYPEYTGTASSAVLKQKVPADPAKAYMEVKDAYRERFHLLWLPPLGFNDTFAMVVRREDGQRLSRPELSSAGYTRMAAGCRIRVLDPAGWFTEAE